MDPSISPYILAFAVLLALAAVLWTISCYGLRKAKGTTISILKKFAEQVKGVHTCSVFLDYDLVKGEHRNRGFEFKLYEQRGAWLLLKIKLLSRSDFYLRIARKSLRELLMKGKAVALQNGALQGYFETMLAIKTSDPERARVLLDPGMQTAVLVLFEDFNIARLDMDRDEIRVTISDPEITGEEYFNSLLSAAMNLADGFEKKS